MNNFTKGAVAALGLLTLSIAIVPAVLAQTPENTTSDNLPADRAAIIAERAEWREQREERRAEFESMTFEEKKEHMLTRVNERIENLNEVKAKIAAATTEEELKALRGPRAGMNPGNGLGVVPGKRGPGRGMGLGL